MARLLGIDIRGTHVRAAVLQTSYRKVSIERLLEIGLDQVGSVEQALQAVGVPLLVAGEAIAVAIEGEHAFMHRMTLPATALKQIEEILPYELEGQIPVDFAELVYDHRMLRRRAPTDALPVMAAAAPADPGAPGSPGAPPAPGTNPTASASPGGTPGGGASRKSTTA